MTMGMCCMNTAEGILPDRMVCLNLMCNHIMGRVEINELLKALLAEGLLPE